MLNYVAASQLTINKCPLYYCQSFTKRILALFLLLFFPVVLVAHNINYALENAPADDVVRFYFGLGFVHIIPEGIDHILFVVGLCLLSTKVKVMVWQATAFTVAHSITLALSMKNIIIAPGAIVEPVISLSIAFIAMENLVISQLKSWRIAIVFLFGLIHGMGFASALNETGLPPNQFFTSILAFNLGVECGQIAVILLTFTLILLPFKNKTWYRSGIVNPLSIIIAAVAAYWTVQRVFFQ
jgi:hypothetical protein